MQEAFINLFNNTNSQQSWALILLLAVSFLLGILVWGLLMHYPSVHKARKLQAALEEKNTLLERENKDFSQRNIMLEAELKRTTESLETTVANLNEKTEKANDLATKLQQTSEQLTLYRDNARSYKENYEELMTNYQTVAGKYDKTAEQLESLKSIVEEIEKEKEVLRAEQQSKQYQHIRLEEREQELTQKLVKSTETIELLKKDLDEALIQRADLKRLLFEQEANQNLDGSDENELKEKVVRLQSHVKSLEKENNDLLQQLLPYVNAKQQEEKEAAQIEEQLVEALANAEINMNNEGFYVGYSDSELIEDQAYLEGVLAQEKDQVLAASEDTEALLDDLTQEEAEEIAAAEYMVQEAMSLQGFYNEIQEETLIQHADGDWDTIGDDEQHLEEQMNAALEIVHDNPLYREDLVAEEFIEDQALLDQRMQEDIDNPIPESMEDAPIAIKTEDHVQMDAAFEMATEALSLEGLYNDIDSEKLIGEDQTEVRVKNQKMYRSELEQLVVNQIGKTIPKADPNDKDDLKQIDGIGMFIEKQLHYFGIYKFEQIVAFDAEFIRKLTAAIGFSQDTIQRDKWIEQAKTLVATN